LDAELRKTCVPEAIPKGQNENPVPVACSVERNSGMPLLLSKLGVFQSHEFFAVKSVKAGAPGLVPGGPCRELEDGQ
jgi:hypothetical protein